MIRITPPTVYHRLFERLADLIPAIDTLATDAVFCATPRRQGDCATYCHALHVDGDMCLIEVADDHLNGTVLESSMRVEMRVDLQNKIAEVLSVETPYGYELIYTGTPIVNPHRAQINLYIVNWLQVMLNFDLVFEPVNQMVAA